MSSDSGKSQRELTKDWITMMVYASEQTIESLIREGCKVMVFSWEYDEFHEILNEMQGEETLYVEGVNFALTSKGLFNVKKNSIVPLLKLVENEEYTKKFIEKNKENCDYQFIEILASQKDAPSKEKQILNYAKSNYDKIATIISLITQFAKA